MLQTLALTATHATVTRDVMVMLQWSSPLMIIPHELPNNV